jgi:hypothetical protein
MPTFDKFRKMTVKDFKRVFKEAIKVIDEKVTFFNTPEDFYRQILNISNKNLPLPEITNKGSLLKPNNNVTRSGSLLRRDKTASPSRRSSIKIVGDASHEDPYPEKSDKIDKTLILPSLGNHHGIKECNFDKLKAVFDSVENSHKFSSVAHSQSMNKLITNPFERIRSKKLGLKDISPGDRYYNMLIRHFYLDKTKKVKDKHSGDLVDYSLP